MNRDEFDADVTIIGYGPTGVSAANFLGARGIRAIACERAPDIYARARAVTVNDWTMRCYQSIGLDDQLKAVMDETHSLRWITYEGQELTRVEFTRGEMGHARSFAIYQPAMEQVLRDGAARYSDHIELRFGVEVTGLEQDDQGVTVTATELSSGNATKIRSRYVFACDGGSSFTRSKLGIALLGDTVDTRWVVIDAHVKRWWPNRHILTFWSDKTRPVVDIALALGNHRWELPLTQNETERDFQTPDQLWRLLSTMGVSKDDVEIHQHAFYKHHVRHAERWRSGNVFLLGDAAHLMPPWAGQGMQSGIRDAYNLCWKIDEVLNGRLPDSLLDTYEAERAPDVARYTQISIDLGRIIKQELTGEEVVAMQAKQNEPPAVLASPMLQTGWLTGQTRDGSALGKIIPQPRIASTNGRLMPLDTFLANGFTVLGDHIDPCTQLSQAQRQQWDALGARYVTVRAPSEASVAPVDIIDIDGELTRWMQAHGARIIAVRPDRFVAAVDETGLFVPGSESNSKV